MPQALIDPCPKTGRRVITIAQWNARPDNMVDYSAYWFDTEAEACGFEPWRIIDEVDPHTSGGLFDVWFRNGKCRPNVSGDQQIYVSPKHYTYVLLTGDKAKLAEEIMQRVRGVMKCAHDDGKYGMEESAATAMNVEMFEKDLIKHLGELK